jgi:hypothetical protein
MYGTARATTYGYSMFEFEVYGTVGGNISPVVSLTAPANNATYTAPANITLEATATDSDGSVTLVEFYNNGNKIGQDATAPYSFVFSNVVAGTYSFTARATDNQSATTNSSAVIAIVTNAGTNLALGKNAFASSIENAAYAANYAVDGNATGTRWSSQFSDPQWFYVDLGATYNINRVRIVWEAAMGRNYQIYISNDVNNWGTAVKTVTNNNVLENNLTDATGTGRYVRMYGTARATVYGYSMFEFEVYGVPVGEPNNDILVVAPTDVTTTFGSSTVVFPNPSDHSFSLYSGENISTIYLVDAMGKTAYQQKNILSQQKVVFGSDLQPGIYVVILEYSSGRKETQRIEKIK